MIVKKKREGEVYNSPFDLKPHRPQSHTTIQPSQYQRHPSNPQASSHQAPRNQHKQYLPVDYSIIQVPAGIGNIDCLKHNITGIVKPINAYGADHQLSYVGSVRQKPVGVSLTHAEYRNYDRDVRRACDRLTAGCTWLVQWIKQVNWLVVVNYGMVYVYVPEMATVLHEVPSVVGPRWYRAWVGES